MNSEYITLPSLGNIDRKLVRAETNKVNHVLTYISTNNIIELNELIYAGAKLVVRKLGSPQIAPKKNKNPDGNFD